MIYYDYWNVGTKIKRFNQRWNNISHFQILLFPEGTDLTAESKERSNQFAVAHNLVQYHQVLHPKTTGFVFLAQQMMKSKSFITEMLFVYTTLLEKYLTLFVFAKTWWISMKHTCMRWPWTIKRMHEFFPACQ